MQKSFFQYVVAGFLFLNMGCSGDAGFTGSEESSNRDSLSIEDGVATETFQFAGEKAKDLDVVWVIDNSRSMDEEAQHVRENFSKFIDYVEDQSNLRMALISSEEGGGRNGVTLDLAVSSEDYLQIPKKVGSHKGLEIVLDHLDSDLGNFLRPSTQKAFIFVTDDESEDVSAQDFSQAMASRYPGSDFVAHGFVSLGDDESPCGAEQGEAYQELGLASGGKTFNICDQNWESHFETLAKAVSSQVQAKFELASEVTSEDILSVSVNGSAISSAEYSVEGKVLSISALVLAEGQSHQIEIRYNAN